MPVRDARRHSSVELLQPPPSTAAASPTGVLASQTVCIPPGCSLLVGFVRLSLRTDVPDGCGLAGASKLASVSKPAGASELAASAAVSGSAAASSLAVKLTQQLRPSRPAARDLSEPRAPATQQPLAPSLDTAAKADRPSSPLAALDPAALRQQAQPWKLLGRRWHSLGKGFPDNAQPLWPLELAERTLAMLAAIAGEDHLAFEAPDCVVVRGSALGQTWAEVETKAIDSVRVTLIGPAGGIDLDLLERVGISGAVNLQDLTQTRVTLHLTDLKHARSRNLKAFLQKHWLRSCPAT